MKSLKAKAKRKRIQSLTTLISVIVCYVLGIVKLTISIITGAYFLLVSSIFTLLISTIKLLAMIGLKTKDKKTHVIFGYIMTFLMFISGIAYTIYSCRLLEGETINEFIKYIPVAIAIAAFSFVSLVLAIIGLFKRRGKNCVYKTLKHVNFIIALTDILWTQIVLLGAVDSENFAKGSLKSVYLGVGIGIFAIIMSILNLRQVIKEQKGAIKE